QISKETDIRSWRLTSTLAASYLNEFERQVVSSAPNVSVLNRIFNPPKWRARAELGASSGRFTSSLFLNYVGSYTNDTVTPQAGVASWTTVDASIQYNLSREGLGKNGTLISVAVTNLFNRKPPFIDSPQLVEPVHYDGTNANPVLRFVSLAIQHRW